MKIKQLLTLLILSIIWTSVYAIDDENCGTESLDSATFVNLPWIENNQFLLDIVDSIENNCNNCRGGFKRIYQVPIKAVVLYNNTYPGITDENVQQYIRYVNRK